MAVQEHVLLQLFSRKRGFCCSCSLCGEALESKSRLVVSARDHLSKKHRAEVLLVSWASLNWSWLQTQAFQWLPVCQIIFCRGLRKIPTSMRERLNTWSQQNVSRHTTRLKSPNHTRYAGF